MIVDVLHTHATPQKEKQKIFGILWDDEYWRNPYCFRRVLHSHLGWIIEGVWSYFDLKQPATLFSDSQKYQKWSSTKILMVKILCSIFLHSAPNFGGITSNPSMAPDSPKLVYHHQTGEYIKESWTHRHWSVIKLYPLVSYTYIYMHI